MLEPVRIFENEGFGKGSVDVWSKVKLSERNCKIGICQFGFQFPSFDLVVIGLGGDRGGMVYVFWFFIEVVVPEVVGKLVVVVVLDDLCLVVP